MMFVDDSELTVFLFKLLHSTHPAPPPPPLKFNGSLLYYHSIMKHRHQSVLSQECECVCVFGGGGGGSKNANMWQHYSVLRKVQDCTSHHMLRQLVEAACFAYSRKKKLVRLANGLKKSEPW